MDFDYNIAEELEYAWLNFELDLPLRPGEDGRPNPFYVDRPGNPLARLERELLRPYYKPPKRFFSGHRGCGKSTELNRLAASPAIKAKYWPVHFSIRDLADVNDLRYQDVLMLIGGQLFQQYTAAGGRLPDQMLRELDGWRGRIEEQVTVQSADRPEREVTGKLNIFFAELSLKSKLEPVTRREIRQVFERNISELIQSINQIATAIHANEGKPPLVLIDDLDKPALETARKIFYDHRATMLQPTCAIVYTVSSPLFYSPEFEAIRDRAVFLPNVKLHEQGRPDSHNDEGYHTLRMFVGKRMARNLIDDEALDLAATYSGGVFREMARVMRVSIDRAQAEGREQIETADVYKAAAEIRGEYWRILTKAQRGLLAHVYETNRPEEPQQLAPLLQMLAVLEYANGEPWYDIHPALVEMVQVLAREQESNDSSGS